MPVGREGSKTEVRSENLAIPFLAMDSDGAEMEPGNVSTRAAPVESAQGPDPSGSQPGSLGSAEPQFRHKQQLARRLAALEDCGERGRCAVALAGIVVQRERLARSNHDTPTPTHQ